jgi:hypothetical protein
LSGTATGADGDGSYGNISKCALDSGFQDVEQGVKLGLQLLTTIPELAGVADPTLAEAPPVLVNVGAT